MDALIDEHKHCLNCGTELTDSFCPHCGQKASVARLSVKTAIVENLWNAVRMDKRVIPTAALLITRPWVVIRGYIRGHRVRYTQPVRFIIIMCFLNILLQMFLPMETPAEHPVNLSLQESFGLHIWHSIQNFLRDSRVATDLIDSMAFAPAVYLLYLPWGSRRFNLAEYSTAYLYLCGAGLVIDLVTSPILMVMPTACWLLQIVWWIYILNALIKHSFRIGNRLTRFLMLTLNLVFITLISYLNYKFLLGIDYYEML